MQFDWDDANRQHIAKHKISPKDVEEVFAGVYFDLEFGSQDQEERFSVIGETEHGRVLIIWFTWRGDLLRVVTAWDAPRADKLRYVRARGTGHGF